ncbi:WD40-repeat-containing domain protein [Dissophora ornata]|nr:WD40-repeat-containing domain protein [Dissophora ornata]
MLTHSRLHSCLFDCRSTHSTHFGHTARVWDCQIIGQYLISISEDASCRIWRNPLLTDLNDVDDMSDCLACWEGHEGKSAWSVAVSDHGVVATGGGDGGIHLWRLDSINTKDIDLPDISTYYPDIMPKEKEFIRDFVITSKTRSVYGTNTGYILVRDDEDGTWKTLYNSQLLKNYVTMEASRCGRVVVAGCLTGKLVILSVGNEFQPLIADTLGGVKIQFIFLLDGPGDDSFTIAIFRANCTVGVFRLSLTVGAAKATCEHVCDLKLPNSNKAIHAACYSPRYNLMLLGSRNGTVLVYNLDHITEDSSGLRVADSIIQLERCHGIDSVSSILMVTESGEGYEGKDRILVYTTGRDGSWAKYRFLGLSGGEIVGAGSAAEGEEDNGDESDGEVNDSANASVDSVPQSDGESGSGIVLQRIFTSKVTKGWLEQVFFMDGELLLLGFFNKKLFVYNESKHFEIFSMHSGAANRRRWRFLTNNARLEHTRLMFHSGYKLRSFLRELSAGSELFQNAKLQNNFHGREVRHLRFLNDAQPLAEDAPAPIIVASGGEDCRLRMFQYIPYKTKNSCTALRPLCNLKPYLGAAIRCLEWSYTDKPHSYLLFTGGAIESMRAWQNIEDHTGRIIPEHTPLSLGCLELAQCPHVSENLETRIMDLSVFRLEGHPGKHFIATVYSDGASRVWLFDETTSSFVLAVDSSYHNKCILQVSHVKVDGGVMMFTTATDGRIVVWDITPALDLFLTKYNGGDGSRPTQQDYVQDLGLPIADMAVHMSGVNSLYVQNLANDGIVAVSGGDDNALAVSLIEATWDSRTRTISVESANVIARDDYAHGSAIQAVSMINASEIVTTSQDQMISLWRLNRAVKKADAALVKQETQFVHVPDPSTMDTLASGDKAKRSIAIAGIGIQIFDIEA